MAALPGAMEEFVQMTCVEFLFSPSVRLNCLNCGGWQYFWILSCGTAHLLSRKCVAHLSCYYEWLCACYGMSGCSFPRLDDLHHVPQVTLCCKMRPEVTRRCALSGRLNYHESPTAKERNIPFKSRECSLEVNRVDAAASRDKVSRSHSQCVQKNVGESFDINGLQLHRCCGQAAHLRIV